MECITGDTLCYHCDSYQLCVNTHFTNAVMMLADPNHDQKERDIIISNFNDHMMKIIDSNQKLEWLRQIVERMCKILKSIDPVC